MNLANGQNWQIKGEQRHRIVDMNVIREHVGELRELLDEASTSERTAFTSRS